MLKFKDLINGQYYAAIDRSGVSYIFKYDGGKLDGSLPAYLYRESTRFKNSGTGGSIENNSSFLGYRRATPKEEFHLEACITAYKWVPCPEYFSQDKLKPYAIY